MKHKLLWRFSCTVHVYTVIAKVIAYTVRATTVEWLHITELIHMFTPWPTSFFASFRLIINSATTNIKWWMTHPAWVGPIDICSLTHKLLCLIQVNNKIIMMTDSWLMVCEVLLSGLKLLRPAANCSPRSKGRLPPKPVAGETADHMRAILGHHGSSRAAAQFVCMQWGLSCLCAMLLQAAHTNEATVTGRTESMYDVVILTSGSLHAW